jgi:hypothetical protein
MFTVGEFTVVETQGKWVMGQGEEWNWSTTKKVAMCVHI